MTMSGTGWSHFNPVKIVFGVGSLGRLAELIGHGRVLLVTTPGFTRRGVTERLLEILGRDKVHVFDGVSRNPDLRDIEEASAHLRPIKVDRIVALGGGSAIDTGKALSVILPGVGSDFSLRRHVVDGLPLPASGPLPLTAIPTTAGTGSEVTPFATIWDREREKKLSLTSPAIFPRMAVLDPDLTLGLPEDETVASGLDALSQGLESIWNRNANAVSLAVATRAVYLALNTLPRLVREPGSIELRSRMMEASLLAGIAISSTRTALAHSMSYPLTAVYGLPHGIACSFTLPALLDYNSKVDDGRFLQLIRALGLESVRALREVLIELLRDLRVGDRLRRYIPKLSDVVDLAPKMYTPGRADNNIRPVTDQLLTDVLTSSWNALVIAD